MTGIYLRIKRDGKWQAIEVEHLTDEERAFIFIENSERDIIKMLEWMNSLCHSLNKAEKILDKLVEDGLLEKS